MSFLREKLRSFSITEGRIPLPLWLQGVLEAAIVALIIAAVAGIGPLLVFFGDGIEGAQGTDLGVWWAQSWLVLHAVPLLIHVPEVASEIAGSTANPGMFHVWPLVSLIAIIALGFRAGHRLARATVLKKAWEPLLGAVAGYLGAGAVAWASSHQQISSTHWYTAIFIPAAIFVFGLLGGAMQRYYGFAELWDRWCIAKVEAQNQRIRWIFHYCWAGLRAAVVAFFALIGIAAAVFSVQLGSQWQHVVNLHQELNLGFSGAVAVAGINFVLVLNFLLWTLAWTSGAALSLGDGSSTSMFETAVGPVPAFPLFGMLPPSNEWWMWLLLALPLVAGLLAGWWFIREGENHVDESLDVRVDYRWMSLTVSTLTFGAMLLVCLWLILVVFYTVANVNLGIGRLHGLGPTPYSAALWTAGLTAAGGMIGYLLAPLLTPAVAKISAAAPKRPEVKLPTRPEPTKTTAGQQKTAAPKKAAEPKPRKIPRTRKPKKPTAAPETITAERKLPED